jgi:menaquinone-9 beta-reductase
MRFGGLRLVCRARFGFRRHFAVAPWSTNVEVYWGTGFQLVVTPTNSNEVCVSFFTRDSSLRIEQGLAEFPEVAARLKHAECLSVEQGTLVGLTDTLQVASARVALVGDASCSVDGIAGHGLSLGLQQALALGDALAREDMRLYRAAHRNIVNLPLRMTRLLLMMDFSAWIRRKTLKLFESQPEIFARIISVHTSRPQDQSFCAGDLWDLSWRVLAA